MIKKKIYRYTNVELLDQIKNGESKGLVNQAEIELQKRNLTTEELKDLEQEYIKFKEYQEKRKDEPLTKEEWFSFFFLTFLIPKPRWRKDHFSESEYNRFEKHGFDKKAKQASEAQIFGLIFWFIVVIILGIIL